MDDLEALVLNGTYRAQLSDPGIFEIDGEDCPVVEIFGPNDTDKPSYFGHMIESNHPSFSFEANAIRRKLMQQAEGHGNYFPDGFNVFILGSPMGNPAGSYTVVGTTHRQNNIEMPFTDAVFLGPKVFSARCLFLSDDESRESSPAVRVWDKYGDRGFGFLKFSNKDGSAPLNRERNTIRSREGNTLEYFEIENASRRLAYARSCAGIRISMDLLYGNAPRGIAAMKPGDYCLARHIANTFGISKIFESVINFEEEDRALNKKGDTIVTHVDGYERGKSIHNLPVLWMENDVKIPGKKIAKGYVPIPDDISGGFYYMPVAVLGAEKYVGSYIPEAKILAVGKVILAEPLQ